MLAQLQIRLSPYTQFIYFSCEWGKFGLRLSSAYTYDEL